VEKKEKDEEPSTEKREWAATSHLAWWQPGHHQHSAPIGEERGNIMGAEERGDERMGKKYGVYKGAKMRKQTGEVVENPKQENKKWLNASGSLQKLRKSIGARIHGGGHKQTAVVARRSGVARRKNKSWGLGVNTHQRKNSQKAAAKKKTPRGG